jgi:23S rRNA (uracil1939-C5)-methyltransferase
MVQKNEQYKVLIEGNGAMGEGIAKIDGFTVFVANGVEDDRAIIQILKVKKSYAWAKIVSVLENSPKRGENPCQVSGKCGGCQMLHFQYAEQLAFKRRRVVDTLERIGGFSEVKVEDCLPSIQQFHYRNKMIFPIGQNQDGGAMFGFYAPRSHRIIPLEECLLCSPEGTQIAQYVCSFMNQYGLVPYDERTGTGLVRRLFLRQTQNTKEIMVVLSINGEALPRKQEFLTGLLAKNKNVTSVILNINQGTGAAVLGEHNITLWGKDRIEENLLGLSFFISPHSFYQVNSATMELLYQKVLEFASLTGTERIFDLYCGIGTISLCAAKQAKSVIGIEVVEQAVIDARENAQRNNLTNAVFHAGDAAVIMPKLCQAGEKADVVILDPPRKGSDEETLSAILEVSPSRIVYVSCDPATLARDLRFLVDGGYEIKIVQPVDMFPHTAHVECIILMTNCGQKEK